MVLYGKKNLREVDNTYMRFLPRMSAHASQREAILNHRIGYELEEALGEIELLKGNLKTAYTLENQWFRHELYRNSKDSIDLAIYLLKNKSSMKDEFADIKYQALYVEYGDIQLSES